MNCEDFIVPFGKFRGDTLGDILASEPAYLDWLRGIEIENEALAEAVAEMCEKYESEIERAIED